VRLATMLVNLSTDYGDNLPDGGRTVGLTITHDDLARLVGSSREMVSKVMSSFRDEEFIRSSRKQIDITDLPALQQLAEA
jgi:CRP/FNR family transcriptional regulator